MSQVNITLNTNTVDINTTNNQIVVTDPTNPNVVNITQPITSVVEVITAGPQGPAGPAGEIPNTGSFVTTGSFNAFTSSYNTGSFTGSFTGDGSGLTGISSGSSVFQKSRTPANATSSVIDYDTIFNPSNLKVQSSSIFIIDSTSEYYVLGDLTNEGQIIVDGTLKIGGALYNSGSIIGNGIIT